MQNGATDHNLTTSVPGSKILVCGLLGIDLGRLGGRSKDRETAELRRPVSALGAERWRQRCKDIAMVLGMNPDVVSYRAGEVSRSRSDDVAFAGHYGELDEELEKAVRTVGTDAGTDADGWHP